MSGGPSVSHAADAAPLVVEVRDSDGMLVRRIPQGKAAELAAIGWAEWIGRGNRRYLRLTAGAPSEPKVGDWRGGSHTIRHVPIRNCEGQKISGLLIIEHKPLP